MFEYNDSALRARFKALRKVLGKTQKEIGEAIGGSLRTWQNYEIGRSSPNWRVLHALIGMGVNINWLLTGRGEMFADHTVLPSGSVAEASAPYVAGRAHRQSLPLLGSELESEATCPFAFHGALLRELSEHGHTLGIFRVPENTGSSYIQDGRYVIVDTARRDLAAGGLYLLRVRGALNLMLVERDHQNNVYLSSGNPHYREIEVLAEETDELDVIGRAVWADRLL